MMSAGQTAKNEKFIAINCKSGLILLYEISLGYSSRHHGFCVNRVIRSGLLEDKKAFKNKKLCILTR
jgi:hypothetical protein